MERKSRSDNIHIATAHSILPVCIPVENGILEGLQDRVHISSDCLKLEGDNNVI